MELFAMSAACAHARRMQDDRRPKRRRGGRAGRPFLPHGARRVKGWFRDLWRNDDAAKNQLAARVMDGGTPGWSRVSSTWGSTAMPSRRTG
jgi:hypothetical protein